MTKKVGILNFRRDILYRVTSTKTSFKMRIKGKLNRKLTYNPNGILFFRFCIRYIINIRYFILGVPLLNGRANTTTIVWGDAEPVSVPVLFI